MSDFARMLGRIEDGDGQVADQLLPWSTMNSASFRRGDYGILSDGVPKLRDQAA